MSDRRRNADALVSARGGMDRRRLTGRASVAAAVWACRTQLEWQLAAGAPLDQLCVSVATYARVARSQEVPPERMLAVLKRMTARLSSIRRYELRVRETILRALVQTAIESYYGRPESNSS